MSEHNGTETEQESDAKLTVPQYIIYILKRYWWLYVLWWILKLTILGGVTKWFMTNIGCQ